MNLDLASIKIRKSHYSIMKASDRKVKNLVGRPSMANLMGICAGLVGPQNENVENVSGFKGFC